VSQSAFPWILGFALLGSVGAIDVAALFLLFPKRVRERLVPFLVSYATGTLLGASLLGLLPEAIEQGGLLPGLGSVLRG
jgi:zinc and cadmium transporter